MNPSLKTLPMKKIFLPSMGGEVAHHYREFVHVFVDADCWQKAIDFREEKGPGSTLVMELGADPHDFHWPVFDRICVIDAPGYTPRRFHQLARALLRDGADLAAGLCQGELVLTKAVKASVRVAFECGGRAA